MSPYYLALLTGLFGSFHCVGMCGPLAMALPSVAGSKWGIMVDKLLYNMGRIITYALLGLMFGLLGRSLFIAGIQQSISIFCGVFILLFALSQLFRSRIGWLNRFTLKMSEPVNRLLVKVLNKRSGNFIVGLINGLLPCGFVYIALAGATATQTPVSGALFMAIFGLGTFPLMMALSLTGRFISGKAKVFFFKASPWLALAIGVLFIVRGMNLGLPYLSPDLMTQKEVICH